MKNMNPRKIFMYLNFLKKSELKEMKFKIYFEEKNMANFTALFCTWQWLTKYIFSSISKKSPSSKIFFGV